MKSIFDELSLECSKKTTKAYSTSFSIAVNMLEESIRPAIHSIYGFVRFADEIVDSFHGWDKEKLLTKFENDFYESLNLGISLNPILNSFQQTVQKYDIDLAYIKAFLKSMRMDLSKKEYSTKEDYEEYIYGSADVVGLMCLKVFVEGDQKKFDELKKDATSLGSAFQKVNFLRDLKSDVEILERSYFPNINLNKLNDEIKNEIILEIENDFKNAKKGIINLPIKSKFGVYTAYTYYLELLKKIKNTPSNLIMERRIRVNNGHKFLLLAKSYLNVKLSRI